MIRPLLTTVASAWLFTCAAQVADSTTIRMADELSRNKGCKEALHMVEPFLAQDPPLAKAVVVKSRCLIYSMDDAAGGMALLETALQREPGQFDLCLFRGDVYNNAKMYDRAEADFELALANAADTASRIDALNSDAWNLVCLRRFKEARDNCEMVAAMDRNNYHSLNTLAIAANELGDTATALGAMRRMNELKPESSTGWINLGYVLGTLDRHAEALDAYAHAAKLGAEGSRFLNNRGLSKLGVGDIKGARQDVGRSIKLDGNNSYAYRNLALIELREGNVPEACDALEKALQLGYTKHYGSEVNDLRKEHCQ
jgi:tetratricopeptide (TPR) repeat protein